VRWRLQTVVLAAVSSVPGRLQSVRLQRSAPRSKCATVFGRSAPGAVGFPGV